MIDPGLDGRVVLVTSANNSYGMGAAVARSYVADPSAPSRACVLATPQEREAEAPSYITVAPSANGQSSSGHRLLP